MHSCCGTLKGSMNRIQRQVVLLDRKGSFQSLVQRSVGAEYEVVVALDAHEAATLLAEAPPLPLLLIVLHGESSDPIELLAGIKLLKGFPAARCLAIIKQFGRVPSPALSTCSSHHLDVAVLTRESSLRDLAGHIHRLAEDSAREVVHNYFGLSLDPRAYALLPGAIHTVLLGGDACDLSARFSIERRTLMTRCVEAGLPAPRRLLAWIRLLLAASLLDDGRRPVSGIGALCGYSSDAALRSTFVTFTGRSPRELRKMGAVEATLDACRADTRATRRHTGKPAQARSGSPKSARHSGTPMGS